jgi:hypothetical protein
MIISNDMLFYAFLFAATMFLIAAYVIRALYHRMGILNKSLNVAIKSKQELQSILKETMLKEERLQRSLDKLVMRRTELVGCLNAAQTDEDRAACFKKLMED